MNASMAAVAVEMLTPIQQRVVWERWFQSEVRALYYADLASLYRRRQTAITWTSLFASSGALAAVVFTLASHRWPWLPAVLALIPTGLSLYSLAATPQQKAADATELQLRWHAFAQENRRLWDAMYSEDAPRRFAEVDAVARELSALSNRLPYESRENGQVVGGRGAAPRSVAARRMTEGQDVSAKDYESREYPPVKPPPQPQPPKPPPPKPKE